MEPGWLEVSPLSNGVTWAGSVTLSTSQSTAYQFHLKTITLGNEDQVTYMSPFVCK